MGVNRIGMVGTVLLIENEEPGRCELCGNMAELRPYGPGNKSICVDCADRDPEGTQERMDVFLRRMLMGTTHVVHPNGEILKT